MPKDRNIVRRGFALHGQKYREGQEFKEKSAKELDDLIKRGLIVRKTFADDSEPYFEPTERQPKVENQERRLSTLSVKKTTEAPSATGPKA